MKFVLRIAAVSATSLLFACSSDLNEGAAQFSTVPATNVASQPDLDGTLFYSSGDLKGSADVIMPGERFSITLLSAFICDFREGGIFSRTFDASNSASPTCPGLETDSILSSQETSTRGEIAIMADFGPIAADTPTGSTDIADFGRVVYYNEDIRETGQLLNDRGVQLHGPIDFTNEVSHLRFAIVEFDEAENERATAIIETLASIGGKAYPPAAPALGILKSVGKTIFQQNKNDVEMRGSLIFEPPSAKSNVHRSALQEGYYAFIRNENRGVDFDWNKSELEVCPVQGLLMTNNCKTTYRERTWLLIRVSREDKDVAVVQNVGQEVSAFMTASSEEAKSDSAKFAARVADLKSAIDALSEEAEECTNAKEGLPPPGAAAGTPAASPDAVC